MSIKEKPSKVRRKRCEYCKELYIRPSNHQNRCKSYIKWKDRLDHDGVIYDAEKDVAHFSGGFKVWMVLGKERKSEDGKIFAKNLDALEDTIGARIDYDLGKDEVYLR